ncbi:hypothetical protein BgiMline_010985 [Biomphalaria glabrata]|nr:hypothetical protein BgiMline_026999 [Biomphalaria glabrata]
MINVPTSHPIVEADGYSVSTSIQQARQYLLSCIAIIVLHDCIAVSVHAMGDGQVKLKHATDVAVSVHAMGNGQVKLKHATDVAVSVHAMGDGQVKLKHATQTLLCLSMLWEMARSN